MSTCAKKHSGGAEVRFGRLLTRSDEVRAFTAAKRGRWGVPKTRLLLSAAILVGLAGAVVVVLRCGLGRIGLEAILGSHQQGERLTIEPCVAPDWPR